MKSSRVHVYALRSAIESAKRIESLGLSHDDETKGLRQSIMGLRLPFPDTSSQERATFEHDRYVLTLVSQAMADLNLPLSVVHGFLVQKLQTCAPPSALIESRA